MDFGVTRVNRSQRPGVYAPNGFGLASETETNDARPSPINRALGQVGRGLSFAFNELDRPLADRIGFNIPDAPGPFDEIGNFIIDEATRPSTLAIALAGAGLAAKAASSQYRLLRFGSHIIEPIGGTSLPSRLLGETAVSAGARVGAELTSTALEDAPTPIRVAGGIAGGILGGTAVFGATRGAVRTAFKEDILRPSIRRLNLRPDGKPVTYRGDLLKAPDEDTFTALSSVSPKQGLKFWRNSQDQTLRSAQGVRETLDASVRRDVEFIGRPEVFDSKTNPNWYFPNVSRIDGSAEPAWAQEVIEIPSRFKLSEQQLAARNRLIEVAGLARKEAIDYQWSGAGREVVDDLGNVTFEPRDTKLINGQDYAPRADISSQFKITPSVDEDGNITRIYEGLTPEEMTLSPSASRQSKSYNFERQYEDPLTGIKAGEVYDHPVEAFSEYARRHLEDTAKEYYEKQFIAMFGEHWRDRIKPERLAQARQQSSKLYNARQSLAKATAAKKVLGDEYKKWERFFNREFARVEDSQASLKVMMENAPEDLSSLVVMQRELRNSIEDGRDLAATMARLDDQLKAAGIPMRKADREVFKAVEELNKRLALLDSATSGRQAISNRILAIAGDDSISVEEAIAQVQQMIKPEPMSALEIANKLGVSRGTVLRRIKSGELAAKKVTVNGREKWMITLDPELVGEDAVLAGLQIAGYKSAQREWRTALQRVDGIDMRITNLLAKLQEPAAKYEELLTRSEVFKDVDEAWRQDLAETLANQRASIQYSTELRVKRREYLATERMLYRFARLADNTNDLSLKASLVEAKKAADIEKITERLEAARRVAKEEIKRAKGIPPGRGTLNPDRYPHFRGYDFPNDARDAVIDYYSRNDPKSGTIGKGLRGLEWVNRRLTPLRASMDMSVTFNQLLPFMFSNPRQFFGNFLKATQDAWDEGVLGRAKLYDAFMARRGTREAASYGVGVMGHGTNPLTDFEFDNWIEYIGAGGRKGWKDVQRSKALSPLGVLIKGGQIHFQSFSTRMRVGLWEQTIDLSARTGVPLSTADKIALARGLNMISGVSNGDPTDVERAFEFAPRFMRAQLETINAAFMSGAIDGQIARQYMRNWIAAAGVLTFFGGTALGIKEGKSIEDAMAESYEKLKPFSTAGLKNGELRLNPNFMTVRIAGTDFSLLGRMDSLARLTTVAADAAIGGLSERSLSPLGEALDYFARTKGNPVVSTGIALATGHDFLGEEVSISNPFTLGTQFLPFTLQDFFGDLHNGDGIRDISINSLANFFGAKASQTSPWEKLQEASNVVFGVPYAQLTGQQKNQLAEMLPNITKDFERQDENLARRGDERAKARIASQQIDGERLAEEEALAQAYTTGAISATDFRERLSELQREAAIRKDEARRQLGVDYTKSSDPTQRALGAWYDLYDKAKVPGTSIIDWDVHSSLEAELFRRIQLGEFGDPSKAMASITDRSMPQHDNPLVAAYFDARSYLQSSGYYAVRDEAFIRFAGSASSIAGAPVESYGQLLAAISLANVEGNTGLALRLGIIKNRVDREVDRKRQIMLRRDPQLKQAQELALAR